MTDLLFCREHKDCRDLIGLKGYVLEWHADVRKQKADAVVNGHACITYAYLHFIDNCTVSVMFDALVSVLSAVSGLSLVLVRALTRNKIRKSVASAAKPAGPAKTSSV